MRDGQHASRYPVDLATAQRRHPGPVSLLAEGAGPNFLAMTDPTEALLRAAKLLAARFSPTTTLREVLLLLAPEGDQGDLFGTGAPPKKEPPRNGQLHNAIADLFCRRWHAARGYPYRMSGGKDGAALKRLCSYPEATLQEVERRLGIALADPFFLRTGSIAYFVARWSNYCTAVDQVQPGAPRRLREVVGIKDGKPVYRE